MIRVYHCPVCGQMKIGSRRGTVGCEICGSLMEVSDLTFLQWSEMTKAERRAYGISKIKKQ